MKAKVPKQFLPFVILFFSARDWLVVVLGVVVIAAETRQVVSFYGTIKSYLGLSHPASLLLTGGGSDRYEHALNGFCWSTTFITVAYKEYHFFSFSPLLALRRLSVVAAGSLVCAAVAVSWCIHTEEKAFRW